MTKPTGGTLQDVRVNAALYRVEAGTGVSSYQAREDAVVVAGAYRELERELNGLKASLGGATYLGRPTEYWVELGHLAELAGIVPSVEFILALKELDEMLGLGSRR